MTTRNPSPLPPGEIASHCRAAGFQNVFILGSYSNRVTISSQQTRAFNLIWGLFKSGTLKEDNHIAVVGGGFAGLSAASAAIQKRCSVTLYEEKSQLLHLQRGNHTRFLHPNILDWPSGKFKSLETKFPFLNWKADDAQTVVDQVMKQWNVLSKSPFLKDVKFDSKVTKIRESPSQLTVFSNDGRRHEAYDAVIIAVGFGVENSSGNLHSTPYWDDDALHRSIIGEPRSREFLVSGCGDGGLIDTLRLRIMDFKHDEFLEYITNQIDIGEKLLEIDREASLKSDPDDISLLISSRYQSLLDQTECKRLLKNIPLRSDTKVVLNGTTDTPFTLKSSILNRIGIYLLIGSDDQNLLYRKAKIAPSNISKSNSIYRVSIDGVEWPENFHTIIGRHGPREVISKIEGIQPRPLLDHTKDNTFSRLKLWQSGFFENINHLTPENGELAAWNFGKRIEDLILLQKASKLRLLGDEEAEPRLLELASSGRDNIGFARFELALFYYGKCSYDKSAYYAQRASDTLPRVYRVISDSFLLFLCKATEITGISLIKNFKEDSVNRFSSNFSTYTSLQRGWSHIIQGDTENAGKAFDLVNQGARIQDIPMGYPFIQQCLNFDQLFMDIFYNPNFSEKSKLENWIKANYLRLLTQTGLAGQHSIIVSTAKIVHSNEMALQNFQKFTQSWAPNNRPSAEDLKKRLEIFLTAI